MEYGLIGENLSHSYSKIIHENFGLYKYSLCNMSLSELEFFLKGKNFKGVNITIPYKKTAMLFCDDLDAVAKKTGSVNTLIVDMNNNIIGYNTDYYGLKYTIERFNISLKNKKVLILGSGGTCATAKALSVDLQAKEVLVASRDGVINYNNIYNYSDVDIIINTTPVGMYPNNQKKLIDVAKFKNLSGLIDVIYNPFYTGLMIDAKKLDVPVAGGLPMLVAQATASAEIFKNAESKNNFKNNFKDSFKFNLKDNLTDNLIEETIKKLFAELSNIVFVGMPGSGKTTIGKIIAKKLKKRFVDTDLEIEKIHKTKIPEIFKNLGEEEFRKTESDVLKKFGKMNNLVISTGGGAVMNPENYYYLAQNSRIYWLNRDLNLLETKGRPLSKNLAKLKNIYQVRKFSYQTFSDKIIDNNNYIENTTQQIIVDFEKFGF